MSVELAEALYRETVRCATHTEWTTAERMLALATLAERLFVEATKQEQVVFSTLFARICYLGHKFSLQPDVLRRMHLQRRNVSRLKRGNYTPAERDVRLGVQVLADIIQVLYNIEASETVTVLLPEPGEWTWTPPEIWDYKTAARVVALRDDPEHSCLIAVDEEEPGAEITIRYNLPDRNENFNPTIQLLRKVFGFPVALGLADIDIDRNGVYRPRILIVEPDYLVDVSAVAESFQEAAAHPLHYLVRKFLPYETTGPIVLGNIANYFLDRLLHDPDAQFSTVFKEVFQQAPFTYAPMTDMEVRDLAQKAKKHFNTLRQMAIEGFAKEQITLDDCVLEPSFFSARYGLQGRLDLFCQTEERAAIVELKSGTPFKPNNYGLQRSHFTQTLLYDLLVRSVFGRQTDPVKYILYSGADVNPLRFAPLVEAEQWEALQVRNQLVALEYLLLQIQPGNDAVPVLQRLRASQMAGKGFLERDFALFEGVYSQLDETERHYFNAFTGFIARENWFAKVGQEDADNLAGHAARWRSSLTDKEQAFAILSHLRLDENRADQPEPTIRFLKTEKTNPLANFRVGDIVLLYPSPSPDATVLDNQIIKCSISALDDTAVCVQVRYRQSNLRAFETNEFWSLEPDLMETGFMQQYRGLFEWASQPANVRRRLLAPSVTLLKPSNHHLESEQYPLLTAEQFAVFEKIIHTPHFFLLWGPPGTGKTSVLLHTLAGWVLEKTDDNLLLLAYTNRAVDEICAALDDLGGDIRDRYLRIGSRLGCAPAFQEQLLHRKVADAANRAELRTMLEGYRIVVSTVASFAQHEGLLKLKKFQRLVVDEASQLLEPQLIGLLTRFDHAVLIGDHRQLPAVTTQSPEMTLVDDPALNAIGLTDLRDSYFERLYRYCIAEGLEQHIGRLMQQGRMHNDLMAFPNQHFYDGLLQILPDKGGEHPQLVPPAAQSPNRRVWFLPVEPPSGVQPAQKTNVNEAQLAARLVSFFKQLYIKQGLEWQPAKSLGIITPWRAQIAQLQVALRNADIDPSEITIDTVERYQGGAREVIIISTCVNNTVQLAQLVNRSAEGIDRKLNVALTRARQYVVVLGNTAVLAEAPDYRVFMKEYGGSFEEMAAGIS